MGDRRSGKALPPRTTPAEKLGLHTVAGPGSGAVHRTAPDAMSSPRCPSSSVPSVGAELAVRHVRDVSAPLVPGEVRAARARADPCGGELGVHGVPLERDVGAAGVEGAAVTAER